MPVLRVFLLLLALLSGGLAHASYSFDSALRASDAELDSMRGGFVVSLNGREFMLPFSITGIERLTQVGSQVYLNGELMSPRLNPQALIPISQMNQISVGVQALAPVDSNAGLIETVKVPTPDSLAQAASGSSATLEAHPSGSSGTTALAASNPTVPADTTPGGGAPVTNVSALNTQVTTHGSSYIIQAGAGNMVVLPSSVSLDSLAAFIQNSVNNQVIRNITTLNITLQAQMLAAQARLNSIRNQSLNGLR